jgi:hypothetical protein
VSAQAPGPINVRLIKATAQRLPAGHPLREAILAAPDELRRAEAWPTLEVWMRLACPYRRG